MLAVMVLSRAGMLAGSNTAFPLRPVVIAASLPVLFRRMHVVMAPVLVLVLLRS